MCWCSPVAIFFALKRLGILRVSEKTELKGLDVTEHVNRPRT